MAVATAATVKWKVVGTGAQGGQGYIEVILLCLLNKLPIQGRSVLYSWLPSALPQCDQATSDIITKPFLLPSGFSADQMLPDMIVWPQEHHLRAVDCRADEPFSFVMRVTSQSQSEESAFVCGEEKALVLKAVCGELMTESYFCQDNIFLSFNEYLMDVYNFFFFLAVVIKIDFICTKLFCNTRINEAMFPVNLCPYSLMSFLLWEYLRGLSCPLFCDRAGYHQLL